MRRQQEKDFFTGGSVIMDYGLIFWTEATVWSSKCLNDGFVSYKQAAFGWWTVEVWIACGLLWCFYQLFGRSFWRHPFTAEHPLLSKWCNALQIWWRNKLIYILDNLRMSTFSVNFYFWVNYSFKGLSRVVHVHVDKLYMQNHKYSLNKNVIV